MTEPVTDETGTEPRIFTVEEAADLLKVSERTVTRAIKDGRLKVVKVAPRTTRITLEAIREFLEPAAEEAS